MQKNIVLDADTPNYGGGVQQVSPEDKQAVDQLRGQYDLMRQELAKVIIGQDKVVEEMLICILSRGHGLLMGVPGLATPPPLRQWVFRVSGEGDPWIDLNV